MKKLYLYVTIAFFLVTTMIAQAQLGSGWVSYSPTKKIHLDNEAGLQTFNWTAYKSVCTPICSDYDYNSGTNTETFRLLDNRTNRSEIRLQNEYSTGSRQFEGYVTFYAPLDDESLMQIFGSTSGATQMMIRGYAANGGSMTGAGATLITGIYGVEVRVNVIHLQEDVGNKIMIYINGVKKAEIADNEAVTNYHKYGNYGTLRTDEAVVKWRNARFFRDGTAPSTGTAPAAPNGLLATTVSASQINLTWNDNASNETGFVVERSADGSTGWASIATPGTNVESYSNTGLTAATTYYYRVHAVNAAGNSGNSNTANATTQSGGGGTNLALNKTVTASGSDANLPSGAVDGDVNTRWSAQPMPQWIEVDLGAIYDVNKTEAVCYQDRAYQFIVEGKTTAGGSYTQLVNRSANTTPGTVAAPITDNFGPVQARYVRVNVTGASGYTGAWASFAELRVFGSVPASLPSIPVGTQQAEALNLSGYEPNNFEGADGIRAVSNSVGFANGLFSGATGTYNVTVRYFDENDGASILRLLVNGTQVGTITLDVNDHTWKDWNHSGVSISNGDEIRLEGSRETGEHQRIDYITIASGSGLLGASATETAVIEQEKKELSIRISPNPVVNKQTKIQYSLLKAAPVRIAIYSINGQEQLLTNAFQQAGNYSVTWNAAGKPAGIYVARIMAGGASRSIKVVVK